MKAGAGTSTKPRSPSDAVFAAFVIVTASTFFLPFKPILPGLALDSSWVFAINQAVLQKLAFGKDFIFTFGPLGYVFTPAFTPGMGVAVYSACAFMAIAYAVALLLLVRGHSKRWMVALLLTLSLIHWSIDGLLFSYPFFVALICGDAVARKGSLTGKPVADAILLAFLFSVVGLLPLVKGTLVVFCALIVGLTALFLLANRRLDWLAVVVGASTASLVGFWMVSGQPIAGLASYFGTMSDIIAGYTDAMSVQGNSVEPLMYIVASLFIAASLYISDRRLNSWNLFILALFGLFLFMGFKASFVRQDTHTMVGSTALLIAVFSLKFLNKATYVWTAAGFSALAIAAMYVGAFNILDPDGALFSNYKYLIASFGESKSAVYASSEALVRKSEPLKVLPGTSDIYSYDQNQLFASGNRWDPRPIAQSYSAYTPRLAMLDAQHLMSSSAPDNIFLSLEPIDNRAPTMEDGPSLVAMLLNDHPTGFDGRFLVLRKNAALKTWAPAVDGAVLTGVLGETLAVPDLPGPVFAQIELQRSQRGKLEEILYKPSQLNITLTLSTGEHKTFRFVPNLGAAGFILSPIVMSAGDFKSLFDNILMDQLAKVRTLKIEAADPGMMSWKGRYVVRFTSLPVKRTTVGGPVTISRTEDCDGHIDSVEAPSGASPKAVNVRGWAAHVGLSATALGEVYVVLTDASGARQIFPAGAAQRPDVAAAKANNGLLYAGFDAKIPSANLTGKYDVQIAYRESGNRAVLCRPLAATVEIPPA